MRIALVHSFYSSDSPSGENVVVEQQREALEAAGHTVGLVSLHSDVLASDPTYKFRTAGRVATGIGHDPTAQLEAFEPDVVHVHNLFPNFGTRWLRGWVGPVVSTLHNFRPACANGMLLRDGHGCTACLDAGSWHAIRYGCYRDSRIASVPLAIRNLRGAAKDAVLSRSDAVVCPGEHVAQQYQAWGVDAAKLHVIPHFSPEPSSHPTDGAGPWVLASRLSPEKGVVETLRAWPAGERLAVFGDGPQRSEVEHLATDLITYHGRVPQSEVSEAIAHAPALIIPSTWQEIGPLTYAEALAVGTPVIALRGNAAALDVERAGTGAVMDSLATLGETLIHVRTNRKTLSAAAQERFNHRHSRSAWYQATISLYEDVQARG